MLYLVLSYRLYVLFGVIKEGMTMKFLKTMLSVLCFLAIGACTVICLYEVYNSYISKDPKNVITYRQLMQDSKEYSYGYKATEDIAITEEVASPAIATVETATDENASDFTLSGDVAGGIQSEMNEIKTANDF